MPLIFWIWLSELKLKPRIKHALLDKFRDAESIYGARESELLSFGTEKETVERVLKSKSLENAEKIYERCIRAGIDVIPLPDTRYPERLRNIENAPIVLYALGAMPDFDRRAVIALVGTRSASQRSRSIAYDFACELTKNGLLVISGMAEGVDAEANRAGLDTAGSTVAVLGCGADICYPASSVDVYNRIKSGGGCIISEYPPGTKGARWTFPARNRILSGLSLGALVVTAPEKSGALITANHALDQNRDVFIVPGGIDDPEYAGSNELIKQGACAVTAAQDIISEYRARYPEFFRTAAEYKERPKTAENAESRAANPLRKHGAALKTLSPDALSIAESIAAGHSQLDAIVEATKIDAQSVLTELTLLELEGIVNSLPGKRFEIN